MQIIKVIIVYLPIILLGTIGLLAWKDKFINFVEFFFLILVGILATILYNFILYLIFCECSVVNIPQSTVKYELVSTKFNNNIEGDFFLGTGNIKDKEYAYYTIRNANEIIRKRIEQYQIFISEDQSYVEIQNEIKRTERRYWLLNIDDVSEETVESKAIFYIPENSIIQNINID